MIFVVVGAVAAAEDGEMIVEIGAGTATIFGIDEMAPPSEMNVVESVSGIGVSETISAAGDHRHQDAAVRRRPDEIFATGMYH